jgi:hypothetical protein
MHGMPNHELMLVHGLFFSRRVDFSYVGLTREMFSSSYEQRCCTLTLSTTTVFFLCDPVAGCTLITLVGKIRGNPKKLLVSQLFVTLYLP